MRGPLSRPARLRAFTLTEGIVAVVILGILTLAGVPAFFGIRRGALDQNAISAASTINQAQQSYKWRVSSAATNWSGAANDSAKYLLIQPYMPFSSSYPTLTSFVPAGYTFTLGANLDTRVAITGPSGGIPY